MQKNAVVWENSGNGDEMGFDVAEANPNYKSDENGWLYSKDGKIMYFAYLIGDEFVIPDGVVKVYKRWTVSIRGWACKRHRHGYCRGGPSEIFLMRALYADFCRI